MAPAQTPSPLPIHKSFLSLPAEILAVIILHVDTPTAIALRRVALHFSTLDINQHLLSDLSLAVSDHEEGISLPNPSTQEIETAKAAEAAISQRLLAKAQAVLSLLQLNPKLSSIVHALTLIPRPSAIPTIIEILKILSPTLRCLRIFVPHSHPCDSHWRVSPEKSLGSAWVSSAVTLPALRAIELGPWSHDLYFGWYLCHTAPNLYSADIDVSRRPAGYDEFTPGSSSLNGNPPRHKSVQDIRFSRKHAAGGDVSVAAVVIHNLRHFPNLRSVSFDSILQIGRGHLLELVTRELGKLDHLEALDWRGISPEGFFSAMTAAAEFAKLRRLVLGEVDWNVLFQYMRPLPKIETFLFVGLSPSPIHPITKTASAQAMTSTFATALRGSPNLRYMHVLTNAIHPSFASIQSTLTPNVFSIYINETGDELLHARLLVRAPGTYQDYTDYEGDLIPLEILDEMGLEEGVSKEQWRGRQREIGMGASMVLCRWGNPYGEYEGMVGDACGDYWYILSTLKRLCA